MGNNLPPGAANDPRAPWNEPDHTHEHEWQHVEQEVIPVIEDGAAIFSEKCMYAGGRYGDGWQCDKTRTYRFEYSKLVMPNGKEYDLHPISNWEMNREWIQKRVIEIEEKFRTHGPDDEVSWDVDPDPVSGIVHLEYDGWDLQFEP